LRIGISSGADDSAITDFCDHNIIDGMRIKTSVTLPVILLEEIDRRDSNRSALALELVGDALMSTGFGLLN
jgi:hypothetical protein